MVRISKAYARQLGITKGASAPRGMNKLETRFAEQLEAWKLAGEVAWWDREPIRVRLASGAWYKPDFVAESLPVCSATTNPNLGRLIAFEVKGHWREAARVRIKVAADRHRWLRFVVVTWDNGWVFEEVVP